MPSSTDNVTKPLSDLPLGSQGQVSHVDERAPADAIAVRLRDLGFVRGEPVRVVAAGPVGRVRIPQRVPIGFHACWIPGDDLAS